jgi:hypothetical protein
MIYPVVADLAADGIVVVTACRVLGVSTSGFYNWRSRPASPRSVADQELAHTIGEIHRMSRGTSVFGASEHRPLDAEPRGARFRNSEEVSTDLTSSESPHQTGTSVSPVHQVDPKDVPSNRWQSEIKEGLLPYHPLAPR